MPKYECKCAKCDMKWIEPAYKPPTRKSCKTGFFCPRCGSHSFEIATLIMRMRVGGVRDARGNYLDIPAPRCSRCGEHADLYVLHRGDDESKLCRKCLYG